MTRAETIALMATQLRAATWAQFTTHNDDQSGYFVLEVDDAVGIALRMYEEAVRQEREFYGPTPQQLRELILAGAEEDLARNEQVLGQMNNEELRAAIARMA